MHKKSFSYEEDYQDSLSDLTRQIKMNKIFIKKLPVTQREIMKELGSDVTVSGVVSGASASRGFGDEPEFKGVSDAVFFK